VPVAPDLHTLPAKCRHRFPIFEKRVYVNSCSQGALSDAVRAASVRSSQYSHGAPCSSQSRRYCSYEARTASESAPCEHELT
jgi:hypothetical protein